MRAVVVAVTLVGLGACASGGTGGGRRVTSDAGPPPVRLMDSGPASLDAGRPGFDAGRPGFDAGRPGFDAGRPGFDAGRPGGGRFSPCAADTPLPRTAPSFPGVACRTTTLDCINACTSAACQDACFAMDAPDCRTCFFRNAISCANGRGCQGDWEEIACCVNLTCPDDPDLGCTDTTCAAADMAWSDCADGVLMTGDCDATILACFGG